MKNLSKRKQVNMQKKHAHCAPATNQVFQMLVDSISETRDEDVLARMLLQSQIG